MGMAERSIDEVRQYVGNGVKVLIEKADPVGTAPEMVDKTLAVFREHYLIHGLDRTRPYDGILEMLGALKEQGCKIAVVSNKFYAATQELCLHFFKGLVDVAIGEREDIRRKPSPDTVLEALRQLGVSKESAVYVGDSDVDIATARNCAMPCISVLWGFRDRNFLLNHGATTFAEKPLEIYQGTSDK